MGGGAMGGGAMGGGAMGGGAAAGEAVSVGACRACVRERLFFLVFEIGFGFLIRVSGFEFRRQIFENFQVFGSFFGFRISQQEMTRKFGDGFRGVCVRARACVAVRARVPAGEPVGTSSYRKLLVALGGAISGRGKFWARTFLPEIAGGAGKHVCGTSSYRKLLVALGNMST